MRRIMTLGGVLGVLLLVLAVPQDAAAQTSCWNCVNDECLGDEDGWMGGCQYTTICDPFDPEDCWDDCSPGSGQLCHQQYAILMDGQVVTVIDAATGGDESIYYDEDTGTLRHACSGNAVVVVGATYRMLPLPASSERKQLVENHLR